MGGDDASGAGIAAAWGRGATLATLVALRDAGDPLPAAAVAMSPWTDLALTGDSVRTRADVDVMIKPDGARESAETYLAGADAFVGVLPESAQAIERIGAWLRERWRS
jgi:hypothetical protein